MEEKQSYYIVIPTIIFEDENISSSCKILYGLISSLINKDGYCYAGNDYLASKINTTPENVSRLLKSLREREYVEVEHISDGAIVRNRKIYISSRLTKMLNTVNKNVNRTVNKNVKESNKVLNSNIYIKEKIYKKENFKKPTYEEVKAYCEERQNKIDGAYFIDHYESNGWKVGKNPMKDWKATIRTWEKRNQVNKKETMEERFKRVLGDD